MLASIVLYSSHKFNLISYILELEHYVITRVKSWIKLKLLTLNMKYDLL